jgi:hypothetical protein
MNKPVPLEVFAVVKNRELRESLDRALCYERNIITDRSGARFAVRDDKIVLIEKPNRQYKEKDLEKIFSKIHAEGFEEWLMGKTGWRWGKDLDKKSALDAINKLQSVLWEVADHCPQFHCLRYFHGEGGEKTQLLAKKTNLREAVRSVRDFLETLEYELLFNAQLAEYLGKTRVQKIRRLVSQLFQSSNHGPDAIMLFACHAARNSYPLSVVTRKTMVSLVSKLAAIFHYLFVGKLGDNYEALGDVWQGRASDWENMPEKVFEGFASRQAVVEYIERAGEFHCGKGIGLRQEAKLLKKMSLIEQKSNGSHQVAPRRPTHHNHHSQKAWNGHPHGQQQPHYHHQQEQLEKQNPSSKPWLQCRLVQNSSSKENYDTGSHKQSRWY